MDDIVQVFEQSTGTPCDLIIGSSGKLTAQIREGAPYHLFVSADLSYPEKLYRDGLSYEKPVVYAKGKLVLWCMDRSGVRSVADLRDESIKYIAMANAQLAPYGLAAEQVLSYYGMLDQVSTKLVFGESISQTNQFILSGAADAGFTAKSVVMSPQLQNKGRWIELPDKSYDPIEQGVIILKRNPDRLSDARKFYQFLLSDEAKNILSKYGYEVN